MNCFSVLTAVAAMFMTLLISVNFTEAYFTRKQPKMSQQQLRAFQNEAFKTKKDLEILANLTKNIEKYEKRQRRQELESLNNNFPGVTNKELWSRQQQLQLGPNCNLQFNKDGNGAARFCCSDRMKYNWKPVKELNNVFGNFNQEYKKLPREISFRKSKQKQRKIRVHSKGRNNDGYKNKEFIVFEEGNNLKIKATGKSRVGNFDNNRVLWAKNGGKSLYHIAGNNYYNPVNAGLSEFRSNSDLSSCQHCAEQANDEKFNKNLKYIKSSTASSVDIYPNNSFKSKFLKKFTSQTEKPKAVQPYINSMNQRYSINDDHDDDEDYDEEDNLFRIQYPSVILVKSQHDNKYPKNGYDLSAPEINTECITNYLNSSTESPLPVLNDQIENTKNNLSHEANYKLSKDEQDKSEKKKGYSWKWSVFKRSQGFNPMNEIKLKTSKRLMQKGFGASLPSYALGESHRDLLIGHMLRAREREKEMLQEKNGKYIYLNEATEKIARDFKEKLDDFDMTLERDLLAFPPKEWNYNTQKKLSDARARYKRELNEFHYKVGGKCFDKPVVRPKICLGSSKIENYNSKQNLKSIKAPEIAVRKMFHDTQKVSQSKKDNGKENFLRALNNKEIVEGQLKKNQGGKAAENSREALKLAHNLFNHRYTKTLDLMKSQMLYNTTDKILKRVKRFNPSKTFRIYTKIHSPKALEYYKLKGMPALKLYKKKRNIRKKRSVNSNLFMARSSAGNNNWPAKLRKTIHRIKHFFKVFIKKSGKYLVSQKMFNKTATGSKDFANQDVVNVKPIDLIPNKAGSKALSLNKLNEASLKKTYKSNIRKNIEKRRGTLKVKFLRERFNLQNLNQQDSKVLNKTRISRSAKDFENSLEKNSPDGKSSQVKFKSKYVGKSSRLGTNEKSNLKSSSGNRIFFQKISNLSHGKNHKQIFNCKTNILKKVTASNILKNSFKAVPHNLEESMLWNTSYLNDKKYGFKLHKVNKNNTKNRINKSFLGSNTVFKHKILQIFDNTKSFYKKNLQVNNATGEKSKNYLQLHQNNLNWNKTVETKMPQSQIQIKLANIPSLNESSVNKKHNGDGHNYLEQNKTKKRSSLNESFEIRKHADHYNKHLKITNKPQESKKKLKRFKRSLNTNLQEDPLDKIKFFNKRNYFSYNNDLNRPDLFSYKPASDFSELQNNFGIEELPINREGAQQAFTNNNFKNIYKTFDREDMPQSNQFGTENLDNLWFKNKSLKKNSKQQKRFLKTFTKNRKLNKIPKARSANFFLNYLSNNKTQTTKSTLKEQSFQNHYLNDLKNYNENYTLNGNWYQSNMNPNNMSRATNDSESLGLELHNEILNCKAYPTLEDFIKSLPRNMTQKLITGNTETTLTTSSTEIFEMDINTLSFTTPATITSTASILHNRILCITTAKKLEDDEKEEEDINETTLEPTEDILQTYDMDLEQSTTPEDIPDLASPDSILENVTNEYDIPATTSRDDVKLNISLNANIHGHQKYNHYYGNGSFNVETGLRDDRLRRGILHEPPRKHRKSKRFHIFSQKPNPHEDNEDLKDLVSGKLSANVVKAILNTVQESPQLKALWPSLENNQQIENLTPSNFYAIKNQKNKSQLNNSEKLLAQVMSNINTLIEQQARSDTCIPLRPDLQDFYNMIIKSRQQQDMIDSLESNKIEEQTKIVRKLLKQYEEMPQESAQQVADLRDDLIKNLVVLRQLEDDEEQNRNGMREKRNYNWHKNDGELLKGLQSHYSPAFLKLLKEAELYREFNN